MKFFFFYAAIVPIMLTYADNEKFIFCAHGKWAHYWKGDGHFGIDQIDPLLCTHLLYTFFTIDPADKILIRDTWLDLEENYGLGNLRKLLKLKEVNPKLKVIAGVGGWSEGSGSFSAIAHDVQRRKDFVQEILRFLAKYNFDGLDIDWEYPGHREGSQLSDKEAFTLLLKDLYTALHRHHLILTALVTPDKYDAQISYNISQISKYLDFILLKTYDLHGSWGLKIGNNSPLYGKSWEKERETALNIHTGVTYWLQSGAPSEKLILGVPMNGRGFKMVSRDKDTPGEAHEGPSEPGIYTTDPGMLGFNELCEKRMVEDWEDHWDEEQFVPYVTKGHQWIGYDNEESLRLKVRYVQRYNLGGMMAANIETDDFMGFCGRGKFPLLSAINSALKDGRAPLKQRKTCLNSMLFAQRF